MPLVDTCNQSLLSKVLAACAVATLGLCGCGTNLSEIAALAGTTVATTSLDLFLTDLANAAADSFDRPQPESTGGAVDSGNDGDTGGGGTSPGAEAYAANNCAACHGDSAEGGIGPELAGMDELAALQARFADGASHNGISLTEQDIDDIASFLLGDETGSGVSDGDPASGESLYADSNCSTCHCADASGGCALDAPSLVGTDVTTLDDFLRGAAAHPGGKQDLDDQAIADLEAYFAGLE